MISSRAAFLLCLLSGPLASGQDTVTARTNLEAAAAKGDPKVIAQALGRRGGDWFDIVLSVIGEPMPPLDPTRALVAALPEPEQKGLKALLDELGAAPAPARQGFATALGALTAVTRTFGETKSDPKALADAVALAGDRVKTANHEWLTARGAVARAIGRFDSSLADIEPELAAAVEKLTTMGDRLDSAIASVFHAKALADKGELEKALRARENAQGLLKALGAIEKGAPVIKGVLARVDLALAPAFFDDARDDAALEACARARSFFKTADAMRDLEASAIEAAILIDRGNPAGALEATKAHVAKVPQIKDKPVLTRFSVAVATALRLTGKSPAGLEFLRKAVGRAKELGMSPNEESPLRMAMALVYIQSQQTEAAHAALEVVAKFAEEPALKPLAKAAALNRAILFVAGGRDTEVPKQLERATAITLGGPTIEKVAVAGPLLSIAEALIDQNKPKEALKFLRDASTLSEELGVRIEDVRIVTTTVATAGREPVHVRLAIALGSYDAATQDWAGFEPIFIVGERRLQDVLSKGVPDDPGPADMAERLKESDRQVLKLRRSAAGVRAPITEEEASRIMAFRRVIIDEAWSRAPTFALRRFPRAGSIKRARDNFCGVEGAIFGASVTAQTAYSYAFSRDRFNFVALNASLRVHDAVASFASVAKDARATPASWIAASAPLWEHLIQKNFTVFEDKKWVAICPDPSIDSIPIEALVPPDAKSENFRTLPYLMQRVAVGRVASTSFALQPRNRRESSWVPDPFAAVIVSDKDKPESGLPFAQAFDPAVTPAAPRTPRAGVFKLGETSGDGTDSAPARRPRILLFGRGIPDSAVGWRGGAPAVVCVLDPPSQKEGSNALLSWMIRGARAVIAPKGPIEKPVADALMAGTLRALGQDGLSPIEALTAAQRGFLSTSSKSASAGVTEAHYHPFHWTQLQVWLVNP